jgi:non-ribosomal peptide synthetase-like protein
VAYYSVKHGFPAPAQSAIVALMRAKLPGYMTPSYLEHLPFIPTLVSNKADRERLPPPKSARLRLDETPTPPETETEKLLCRALAEVLKLEQVSIDSDVFADYGAHSLLIARFCAKVRQLDPSMHVAMRDVYANTTLRRLAGVLDAARPAAFDAPEILPAHRPSDSAYYFCGAAQLVFYALLGGIVFIAGQVALGWLCEEIDAPLALYARALVVAIGWFLAHNALAVAGKWLLIGRVRPGTIPLWSVAYFRFWAARLIVRSAPATAFAGTPLFNAYLRLLGAKIGRNAIILSHVFPITADLFEVGEDAVIMRRALVPGHSAVGNRVHMDEIRIGRSVFIGEQSVLDIGTSIGDFGQLGHASSLQRGQHVPDGKRFAGSPAEETATNFRLADAASISSLRGWLFAGLNLAFALAVAGALAESAIVYLAALLSGTEADAGGAWEAALTLLPTAAAASLAVCLVSIAGALALLYAVPRIAGGFLSEGRVYPLYGFHYGMQQIVQTVGNSRFFNLIFGDSAFVDWYLRVVGWKLGRGEQTGSNFGTDQGQDNPFLCSVGANTMASDGLWLGNLTMSSHAFKLGACRVGERNFFGNAVYVPPGARTGYNVLFATKVMVPIDGPMRENVGLLGSPAFEIPRHASRDLAMLAAFSQAERLSRVSRKTLHNIVTIAATLGARWLVVFLAIYVLGWTAAIFGGSNVPAMTIAGEVAVVLSIAVCVLVERASIGFGRLQPETVTVYDRAFWRVERYWKLSVSETPLGAMFAGTPMRGFLWRLLGVKVGRKVFDDGCGMSEPTLVEIGDEANLNAHSFIQAHSLEQGVFKSDRVRIGADCSVGVDALVHYGVTMNERTQLDPDAFLMKGEITPAGSHWRGNPAKLVHHRLEEPRSAACCER